MDGFFERNPTTKTIRDKRIDNAHIKNVTIKSIQDLFNRLKIPVVRDIPPERRHNMDETGIMEGHGFNGLVVGHAERSSIYVKFLNAYVDFDFGMRLGNRKIL